jgi:hypothetical protein
MFRHFLFSWLFFLSSLGLPGENRVTSALVEYVKAHLVNSHSVKVQYPLEHYKDSVSIPYFLQALKYVSDLASRVFYVEYLENDKFTLRMLPGGSIQTTNFTDHASIPTEALFIMWDLVLNSKLRQPAVANAPTFLDKIRVAYGEEAFKEAFRHFSGQSYEEWVANSGCVDVFASDSDDRPSLLCRVRSILPQSQYIEVKAHA